MSPKDADDRLLRLAEALCKLRDSWAIMSLLLKDYLSDASCESREDAAKEVECLLERFRVSNGRRINLQR